MSTVTSVTQFTIATDDDVSLTLSNNNTAASATLTIDATAVTTQAATINGAAEADGNLVITAAGAGAHIITLGSGNDSYTSTSTGVDTVAATAGTNTISVGGGIDVVTSGTGVDTVTLGTDDAADRYIMNNLTKADTITDFDLLKAAGAGNAEDQLELTLLSVEAMVSGTGDLVLAGVSTTSVATNTTMVVADVTGALDLGTVATAMVLNVTGTYAATTDVETALELGGARQLTANGLFAADDAILLSYSNGTDMKVAVAEITGAVADDAIFGPGVLTITDLITLSGITDVSVAIAGNYDIV
jgi:Ca2+-binding RTX toxin-like protein